MQKYNEVQENQVNQIDITDSMFQVPKVFATLRKAENGKVMKPGQSDDITDNMFQVPNNIVFATLRKAENRKDYITVNNSLFSRQGFLRD